MDKVEPLSEALLPVAAPAYRLFCSGSKLPMKDLTLKAGMILLSALSNLFLFISCRSIL